MTSNLKFYLPARLKNAHVKERALLELKWSPLEYPVMTLSQKIPVGT